MQVDFDSPRTAKAQAVLKAQITSELKGKKQCTYTSYECTQLALSGHDYCSRHILCDKNAPYMPCSHVFANGKRCMQPAQKTSKKDIAHCSEHALKIHLMRTRQGTRMQTPLTAESLLASVAHYAQNESNLPKLLTSNTQDEETNKPLDPYADINVAQVSASNSHILDYGSESDSDVEPTTSTNVWMDSHADSSDNESIDSEHEDALKYADVLSAEEVTLIACEKLKRMHSLYIDQYSHLFHVLREKRRKYVQAVRRERETHCSIANQQRDTPQEQRTYRTLRAYTRFHRSYGDEAILRKRLNEMRAKITEGMPAKPQSYHPKCTFSEGGIKCTERALPVARHCRKHILKDVHQVLFRACGKKSGDFDCITPVECIFDDQTCILHRDIPPLHVYSNTRKESESESDEAHNNKQHKQQSPEEAAHAVCNDSNSLDLNVSLGTESDLVEIEDNLT